MNTPTLCHCALCSTPQLERHEALEYSDVPGDSARRWLDEIGPWSMQLGELEEYATECPDLLVEYPGMGAAIESKREDAAMRAMVRAGEEG